MNKRDAINHIRQFGGRLDRFRKSVGGSGDGGRNAPKRAKSSPKPVNRKTNVFNEQVRYAFHGALQDLKSKPFATFLTVMVIAISLTLPRSLFRYPPPFCLLPASVHRASSLLQLPSGSGTPPGRRF